MPYCLEQQIVKKNWCCQYSTQDNLVSCAQCCNHIIPVLRSLHRLNYCQLSVYHLLAFSLASPSLFLPTDFHVCACVVVRGVFIVAAKRTPFGSYGGKLINFTTVDLQEIAFKAALTAGNVKPEWINSVIVGNVFPVSDIYLIAYMYVAEKL